MITTADGPSDFAISYCCQPEDRSEDRLSCACRHNHPTAQIGTIYVTISEDSSTRLRIVLPQIGSRPAAPSPWIAAHFQLFASSLVSEHLYHSPRKHTLLSTQPEYRVPGHSQPHRYQAATSLHSILLVIPVLQPCLQVVSHFSRLRQPP